jgi:hypothetical protein
MKKHLISEVKEIKNKKISYYSRWSILYRGTEDIPFHHIMPIGG